MNLIQNQSPKVAPQEEVQIQNTQRQHVTGKNETDHFAELEMSLFAALETYSNVHRGSGHFSQVTTHLYERAREIVLDYLNLKRSSYLVIFCSPRRAENYCKNIKTDFFNKISSREFGLHLGVVALALQKGGIPSEKGFETGGGTTKLYGPDWVMWANMPDRVEAGTPAIINIIAFAKALLMIKKYGTGIFKETTAEPMRAEDILFHDLFKDISGLGLLAKMRENLVGRNILVPTTAGLKPFTNLDNAASTPSFTPIWDAFRQTFRQPDHIRAKIISEVRQICAETFGAPLNGYDIIFTSNTSESINLAAQSLANEQNEGAEPVIMSTILEHSSNDLPWRTLPGYTVIRLSVKNNGLFDLDELETTLRSYNEEHKHGKKRIKLLAVCGASNVLGTCNDLSAIASIARRFKVRLMVDAAQLAAHRKIDMDLSGLDYLALSAHKMYAPFGTGVLIVRKGLLQFSNDELKLINDSGEENAGGIAALGKALLFLRRIGFDLIEMEEKKLTAKASAALAKIPGLKIHGHSSTVEDNAIPKTGVIGFEIKNKMSSKVAGKLARNGGIGVRYGCLCAHLIIKQLAGFTPFQEKMQRFVLTLVPILNLQGITRVSFGIHNTGQDVETLIGELKKIAGGSGIQPTEGDAALSDISAGSFSEKQVKQQIRDFLLSRGQMVFG